MFKIGLPQIKDKDFPIYKLQVSKIPDILGYGLVIVIVCETLN